MESHAAAMIKRFREGKPMSKIEREKLKQEEREEEKRNEMWWIDKKLENTDDIKPRPSPLKPMRNDIPYDPINTFDSPLKPARFDNLRKPISPPRRFDNNNNYNNYNRQNKNEFNFSTRKSQGIDDLITDDIDDSILEQYRIPDLESPSPFPYNNNHNLIKNNNNNNNKSINNNNNNKEYSQSIDDLLALLRVTKEEKQRLQGKEKSLKFQNSTKYDEDDNDNDLDLYRSYEINRQPIDPIDNFGTKSFKSLLIPSMKLDGKIEKNEPKTPDNKAELVHLTTNLEGLLQSFNINRNSEENIPNTEYDVPQTITQVTNTLNSEMLKFTSHYKAKYENEELLEKSQKKRDEEMKAIGKQEAQSKLIMDSKYFSLHCDELTDYYGLESVYSGDEKILESIENSIKKRNLKVNQGKNKYNEKEEEQEEEEEENGQNDNNNNNKSNNKKLMKENSSNYRHHLYDNQQYIRGYDRDVNLSDLSSNINLRRMESLYLLHRLDPPLPQYKYHNYHYEENNIDDEMNKKRHNEDLNDEYELSLRGIDILSQNDVKHRSITSAARDTITCCLNATINTLNLRLPSEDEIKRQESIENELKIKYDEETKKLNDELNSVKQELEKKEQELLEKIKESSSPSSPLPPPYSVEDPYFNNINNNSNNQLIIEKKENNFKNNVTKDDLDKLDKLLGPDNKESDLLKDVLKNKINIEDKQEQKQPQGKNKIYFQTINDIEHQISHRGNEPTKHIQKFINTSTITKPEKTQPSAPFIPIDKVPLPPNKTIDREVLSNDTKSLDISRHEREAYLQKMKSLRKQLMT